MVVLTLTGYLEQRGCDSFALFGDNAAALNNLGSEYWKRGVCKHVNSDKTECTIKTTKATTFAMPNNQYPDLGDLNGCYVKVTAAIKKYTFFSTPGTKVSGWQIIAKTVARTSSGDLV